MLLTSFTHNIWKQIVPQGSFVIDATCGNGHDTLMLAQLALKPNLQSKASSGFVFAIDIQPSAIESTKKRLEKELPSSYLDYITFQCASHENLHENIKRNNFFPESFLPSADIIAYNLGYLPGGNKEVTTTAACTVSSLKSAFNLLKEKGWLSITCYTGHKQGAIESEEALHWAKSLKPHEASIFHCAPMREKAPFLLLVQKS